MEIIENGQNVILKKKAKNEVDNEGNEKKNENTFRRLKNLQALIKKKSEMKNQCMYIN